MSNTFKDFTVNVKKSIDREYGGNNREPDYDDDQRVIDDNVISSIEDSYDDDYEDYNIIVDHSDEDDESISPDLTTVDMIKLIKVRTIKELSNELENVNKTEVPAIIDFKYLQERRPSEFAKVVSELKTYKSATNANVVLLGSTKNVVVVTPESITLLKQG